eukprot:5306478-Pleurochrysis_carterae.AAC.1
MTPGSTRLRPKRATPKTEVKRMTLKPTRMMSTPGTKARTRRRQRRRADETIHGQKAPLTLLDP